MASAEKLLAECLEFAHKRLFREKRTRTDVVQRKERNKETTCTVVKCTWNSFCKSEGQGLDLKSALFEVNKAVTEAYMLANLHVLRLCEAKLPIPELNQSYFYQCLSAVSVGDRKRSDIKEMQFRQTVDMYNTLKPAEHRIPQCAHLSGFFQQASQQMVIAAKNSTSLNFYRRFKRYLKIRYTLDNSQAYHALKAIQADAYEGNDMLVQHYRRLMPPKPARGQREEYPEVVMPMQYMFLKYYDSSDKQCRMFSLLPLKQGFECSHIKMCSNGLQGLLKRSNINAIVHEGQPTPLPKATPDFRNMSDQVWRYLFNIKKFETANRKFAGEILTDGKAVSIVLRKPKQIVVTESGVDPAQYDELWGIDPGRREIFVASNLSGQTKRCTTSQYYHKCGIKASKKKTDMWAEKYRKDTIELNVPSMKTSSLTQAQEHITYMLTHSDDMLRFRMKKGYRKLKFRRYVMRQHALRDMCLDLTAKAGRRTLVGFGDWSNKDSAGIIKKCPMGPVKKFEHELKRYCRVVSIDEYATSKTHEACHCTLHKCFMHKRKKKSGEALGCAKVHSVFFCANKSCRMLVNRDTNASRNILTLLQCQLQGFERPLALQRTGSGLDHCLVPGTGYQVAAPAQL